MIAAVAVGASLLIAAATGSSERLGAAARLLPVDGFARWIDEGDRLVFQEHRRSPGITPMFAFPEAVQSLALTAYEDGDAAAVPHWVDTRTGAGEEETTPQRDMYRLGEDGVRLVASVGTPTALVFAPGMLVLTADAAPGRSWDSEGVAMFVTAGEDGPRGAEVAYRSEFTAAAPADPALRRHADDPGCLEVTGRTRLEWDAALESDEFREVALWCPGRGVVAAWSTLNGGEPERLVPADAAVPAPAAPDAGAAGWDVEAWRTTDVEVEASDPVFGTWETVPNPSLAPVAFGDGWAVADDSAGDVSILMPDGTGGLSLRARTHPGGDITALGVAHGVLVTATTGREVVAYDLGGRRTWARPLGDLVVAPPLAAPGGLAVVAGLDGVVRGLDAATGEDRWRRAVSADGVGLLVVAGDLAVAVDRAGRVTALDTTDGGVRWHADGDAVTAVAASGRELFVARGAIVQALDTDAGAVRWETEVAGTVGEAAATNGLVAVRTDTEVTALSPATGEVRWTAPPAEPRTDGTTIVLVAADAVVLPDADGHVAGRWAIGSASVTATRWVVAGEDALWWFDTGGGVGRLGP